MFLDVSPIELWVSIGVILLLVEFTLLPAIGFLFLGLGCLTHAAITNYYPETTNYHIASVALNSCVWFIFLWYPLFYNYKSKDEKKLKEYFNITGSSVKVISKPMVPGKMGEVSWSGTNMNAILSREESSPADVGDELQIVEVKGNVLVCQKI